MIQASVFTEESLQIILKILNYNLVTVGGQSVTLKSVIIATLVLSIGIFVSRKISFLFTQRLVRRFQTDSSIVSTIQTIFFYILVSFIVLLALSIAGIPLSVFTLFGGALAIGLGFGSQNILKNFISGIIIMFDRPMKIGDFIEINGQFGKVEKIGFRATQILSYGNIHVIYPNSSFLEQDFINWTLDNPEVRISVRVGVAYVSDTKKVKELLLQAVRSNARVKAFPEPVVLFQDFGDNSLVFDIFFTMTMMELADRRKVESEIRFEIDDLFRGSKITIAYPQRDIHIDSLKPIEVKMID